MNPIDFEDFMMLGAITALVVLVTYTGVCINRFFVHRAHRRALAELQSRALGLGERNLHGRHQHEFVKVK